MLGWVPIDVLCGLFILGVVGIPLWGIIVWHMQDVAYAVHIKQMEEADKARLTEETEYWASVEMRTALMHGGE